MNSTTTWRRAAALLTGAIAVGGLVACNPGPHLELTVTTTADLVDANPGDGVCEATAGLGDCTLRAAVMEANATPTTTTVRVVLAPDEEYVLTRSPDCAEEYWGGNDAAVEDLDITRDLTVSGNGASISTDGGDFEHPIYGTLPCLIRVFENHTGHLALDDLSLDGSSFEQGGALLNQGSAQLTDVSATGMAASGGVVLHNRGQLTLVRTSVFGGSVFGSLDGPHTPWAGIWSQNGSLVLLDSEVWFNAGVDRYSSTDFAGIHVASGTATIIQSIVRNHRGFAFGPVGPVMIPGDGIDARGPVQLIRSTVVDNGDGRDVVGTATVEASGSILGTCGTVVTSLGYNADADGSCLGAGHATDLVATPTTFGDPLDDEPWLPATGSAVIDAIPAGTPDLCDGTWPTDRRGGPRPSGAGCDIGALERQPTDP